uniref:15-hydroxyprostaglandin dehydrogenase [NAD(+)] n=1 Tax=Leptochiton asellus TaxID=211853 RepID=A0A8D7ZEN5_9MOLL|nr:Retinal Dehydrogenase C (RDH-C) [Leptochiton asellus]
MKIQGCVAVVTGGASGIGKATCQTLAAKGAKVCIVDVNGTQGKEAADELTLSYGAGNILFAQADISCQEQFKGAFDKVKSTFGRVDVLVNNAGIVNEVDWRTVVNVNLVGTISGTTLAVEYMGKKNGGSGGVIINIGSIIGLSPGDSHIFPTYASTKAAVIANTLSWSANPRLKEEGFRFNVVCPHIVDTPLIHNITQESYIDIAADIVAGFKAGEKIKPSSVAQVILELIEDDTKNGVIMKVTMEKVEQVEYPTPISSSGK